MKKIKYLGMAARMVPDKLHELLINVISLNRAFFIKNNIKILFAGSGVKLHELKNTINAKKLNKLIYFSGRLSEDSLIKWFRKLDLYVHLSKDETTSTSILQAMAMSLPVIASKVGGNTNLKKSFNSIQSVILVDNEIEEIFNKIKYLILNKKIRKKMANTSRKIAKKYYSSEAMYKRYKKIFNI